MLLAVGDELTSRRGEKEFGLTRDTAARDFIVLMNLGIAEKTGLGPSVSYRRKTSI